MYEMLDDTTGAECFLSVSNNEQVHGSDFWERFFRLPSHEAVDKNINRAHGNVWRTKTVMHHGKRKDRKVQALIKDHVAAM